MKLYEIPGPWRELAGEIEANQGELTPELEKALSALEGELTEKAKAIVCIIREKELEAASAKAESDRLNALAQSKARTAERLKAYLRFTMEGCGIDRLDVGIAQLSVRRASRPAIKWDGNGDLPVEFQRVKIELDGTKAYEVFKAGTALPLGFSVTFTRYLNIR
jgi:hypothetical protein